MTSAFEPRNKSYHQRVIDSFDQQAVMKTLGARMVAVRPGEVEIEFLYQPELTQQHGFIHAGISSTVLDSACGYAAFSLMSEDAEVLTIEFKINLLSPAKGEKFLAFGRVKKPGKNISVAEADLYAVTGDQQKLVASMVGTIMAVYGRGNEKVKDTI